MFNKPYILKGKHATYVRFLSTQTKINDKNAKGAFVIKSTVEIYAMAPLIGLAYNKKAPEDTASNDSYTIFGDAIIGHQAGLDFAFRLVMLSDNSTNLTNDEKIARAFKEDEEPVKLTNNLELFHQYMRGGIEWLYEQFTDGATTKEDYLEKVFEVVSMYKEDFNINN
jgi:hypothetical protein